LNILNNFIQSIKNILQHHLNFINLENY